MDNKEKYNPPKSSAGDIGHAVLRAGLSLIPIAGAAATELLNAIVTPPLVKRHIKWMEDIGEGLRILEDKSGINLESLQHNDVFIDIVLEATRIAVKTSNQEKREALKRAVLNSALPNSPEESLQIIFLSNIENMTVWHLKLLELFDDPSTYLEKHKISIIGYSMGGISSLIEIAFPELKGKRELYDLIWKDLYSRTLVNTDSLHTLMTGSGIIARRTTEIGNLFLDYIKNPFNNGL